MQSVREARRTVCKYLTLDYQVIKAEPVPLTHHVTDRPPSIHTDAAVVYSWSLAFCATPGGAFDHNHYHDQLLMMSRSLITLLSDRGALR